MQDFENIFALIDYIQKKLHPLIMMPNVNTTSFFLMRNQNEFLSLVPKGQFLFYFRGEPMIYTSCYANIYRDFKNEKYLLDRLQQIEFEILLRNSPIIDGQSNFNFQIFDKTLVYQVDFLALSQHYGIATEYLDLTNNLFVALFFATHQGNPPVSVFEGDGVLYCFRDENCNNVNTIGMQLFPRPGEQKAFAVKLGLADDFSLYDKLEKYVFKQTVDGTDYINKLFNNGNDLFPKDIILKKVEEIKNKKQFSYQALNEVHLRYFKNFNKCLLQKKLESNSVDFTNDIPIFTKSQISNLVEYLNIFIKHLNNADCRRTLYV